MAQIPRDTNPESTLALLSDGYQFISKRCHRYHSPVFQTRLLLQPFICMSGAEAAKIFYDAGRFERRGAAPTRLQETLFGKGGMQGMDGQAHRWQKQMFMALMTPEHINQLADLAAEEWHAYGEKWAARDKVVLLSESQELLCRAVCRWAGVPLPEAEVIHRTRDLAATIDGAGAVGPRHWRGRRARNRAEHWISDLIGKVRTHAQETKEGSAMHIVAWHRDLDGALLEEQVAAVELLNVLRPTVAIAWFVTFAAVALHEHPDCRRKLQEGEDGYSDLFVQEVRRFYPFFPFVVARVRQDFDWNGYRFPKGRKFLLDLYGTHHDAQLWEEPEVFRPERFRHWEKSSFAFLPQGEGEYHSTHRCAGEWVTIALMKGALNFLTKSITYAVPAQDLRISLSRIPAIPKSRFVISHVRRTR